MYANKAIQKNAVGLHMVQSHLTSNEHNVVIG